MDTSNVRPKEPAESLISGRKRSLRHDVRLTSPWTIDGVLHLENPLTPGPRTKALRVVAWSAAPRLSSRRRLIIYWHLLAKSKKEHCSARSAVNEPPAGLQGDRELVTATSSASGEGTSFTPYIRWSTRRFVSNAVVVAMKLHITLSSR